MTYDKSYYEKNADALRAYQRDYYYRSKYSNEPKKRKKNYIPDTMKKIDMPIKLTFD